MKFSKLFTVIFTILILAGISAYAQRKPPDTTEIQKAIEKDGCTITDEGKVKICKFDYKFKGKNVEALTFRPIDDGKYPGVMLIPGYTGTPQTQINLGRIFTKRGFTAIAVGTPGFGKTDLEPDFLGKNTIDAFIVGFREFKKESFVDSDKIGIFGYSRGAIAASLMITRIKDVNAAVLGGGVYDLKKAYDESNNERIKENIKDETGLKEKAFKERSAVFKVNKIQIPVLIMHGEKDFVTPASQAYLLRDKLKEANKEFEFHILADHKHGFLDKEFLDITFDFLSRKLKGKSTKSNN